MQPVGYISTVWVDGQSVSYQKHDSNDLLLFTRNRNIGWVAWLLDYGTHALMNEVGLSPTIPYGTTVQTEMLIP